MKKDNIILILPEPAIALLEQGNEVYDGWIYYYYPSILKRKDIRSKEFEVISDLSTIESPFAKRMLKQHFEQLLKQLEE